MSMYANVPSQPWLSSPPTFSRRTTTTSPPLSPASPTSPTRSGRLRGLSYLRTYTQQHLLSRESNSHSSSNSRPNLGGRATSYPSPSSSNRASAPRSPLSPVIPPSPTQATPNRTTSPTAQRSTTELSPPDSIAPTSGWLPTVGGQSGVSRIGTEPQSTVADAPSALLSSNATSSGITPDLSASMARTRSETAGGATDISRNETQDDMSQSANAASNANGNATSQLPSIRFIQHQDPRAQRPSLAFSPMARILPTGKETIKVGRYSEREAQPVQPVNVPSAAPVGFKSKVVSRRHCEFWCAQGKWYIKDVKSSSGTFLNHIRLSSPNTESRPFPINDGDIVQLGIDFKGGEEMIFRCVKIRVELNKGWQNGPTSFNVASHKRLREMMANQSKAGGNGTSQDCSICLGPIQPCQSLFVAPCSHTWHYKCIRTIINGPHWPHFQCPNCRMVADLEADLDDVAMDGEWEDYKASETDEPVVPPAAVNRAERQSSTVATNGSENTESMLAAVLSANSNHTTEQPAEQADIDSEVPSDDYDAGIEETAEEFENLHIHGSAESESSTVLTSAHTTTRPVDIVRKQNSSAVSNGVGSGSISGPGRSCTPSPVAIDGMGPMTPRNDIGPFVFDGTAGRIAASTGTGHSAMNLDSAASVPQAIPESSIET
ncbi:hypothetical protein BP5796_00508 [Coleophoma crateriformis]|uniref:RING-type E3 ubiquitin transferase n=1 Tax=Coleophoma crateriformis TaxID=565419 RepID=A0A3D8T892_9HELO|nr:hypothetical protein BP5796_00508 [Coleophoma crateriformis]